jgi:putative oxidoreductase
VARSRNPARRAAAGRPAGDRGDLLRDGRTKVAALRTITVSARSRFGTDYALPLIPPNSVILAATYSEQLFPILLVLGLGTRGAAAARLGMTVVIEVFVYPDGWPTHLSWAAILLLLMAHGAGRWSLDSALRIDRELPARRR